MDERSRIGDLIDRCERMCGPGKDHCFIDNKQQFNCVADMVIYKIAGVKDIISAARKGDLDRGMDDALEMALEDLSTLVDWIRYLYAVQDLKAIRTRPGSPGGTRRADRFPLPELCQRYINMTIFSGGRGVPVKLLDFSLHGLQFECRSALKESDEYDCLLSVPDFLANDILSGSR